MSKSFRLITYLVIAASFLLSGCLSPQPKIAIMNKVQDKEADPTISTFCTGRFLVDMPAGSVLSGGNYRYDFARLEQPKSMSLEEFETEMAAKEKTRSRDRKRVTNGSLLTVLARNRTRGPTPK